jgi:hypothetical protein
MNTTGRNSKETRIIYKHDPQLDLKLKGFLTVAIDVCPKFFKIEGLKLRLDGKIKEDLSKVGPYLRLLRKHGYAKKFYYRNSITKQTAGTIWVLTEERNKFPDDTVVAQILRDGLELMNPPRNGTHHEAMKNMKKKLTKTSDQPSKENLIIENRQLGDKSLITENQQLGKNLIIENRQLGDKSLITENQQLGKNLIIENRQLGDKSLIEKDQQLGESLIMKNQQLGNANDQKTQRYSTLTTPDGAGAGFGESQNCELGHGSIFDTPYIIYNNSTDNKNNNDYNHNMENTKYFPCPDPPPNSSSGGNEKTGSIESPKLESSNPEEE